MLLYANHDLDLQYLVTLFLLKHTNMVYFLRFCNAALIIVFCLFYCLLNGHILQLRSETVAVRRRMNMVWTIYDGHMIPEEEYDLNFLTFVL